MSHMQQEQLDRIEKKLDEFLELRDLLLRMFMPKIPAGMRNKALEVLARRSTP